MPTRGDKRLAVLRTAPRRSAVGHLSGQESTAGHLSGQESTAGHLSGQESTAGHLFGQESTAGHLSGAVTLICVPYAGGNPEVFGPWAEWLGTGIDLVAVRLPGHGRRMRERPFGTWDEIVDDTIDALSPYLSGPHAFYGHCFGGRLAYELAQRAHTAMTVRLFVSGCRSPDTPPVDAQVYELPDAEFCSALAQIGAAPAEVLGNAALMRILLPAVRSEIRLAELWGNRLDASLDVPITAMYGEDDRTDERHGMTGWPRFSTRGCEFVGIPGGHFFLQADPPLLRDIINSRLAELLNNEARWSV